MRFSFSRSFSAPPSDPQHPWHLQPTDGKTSRQNISDGAFPLRLASVGQRVRLTAFIGGQGFCDRVAGIGLYIGTEVTVLNNAMDGKLLIAHGATRLFLGGGMAHKIIVTSIEGENQ